MQWAPPNACSVPKVFGYLVRMQPIRAWLLVVLCTEIVALIDYLTGSDLWLGPGYLLVICVAAWSLGWKAGQVMGIASMVLTFAINGVGLYPNGNTEFAVNLLLRFCAISLILAVFSGVRWTYLREWWLARTDILTAALNRQAFFELGPTAVDAHRWRLLIYADLDGLKKVNDLRGHAAGDACLKAYAEGVRKAIRKGDIFARMGGDEFVIFMHVRREADARNVAARLHRVMNDIPTDGDTLNCSVGALIVPPGDASLDDLVRSADDLMYEAKLRGACLQLATASNVKSVEIDRTLSFTRGMRALVRKERANDRRGQFGSEKRAGPSLPIPHPAATDARP